MKYLITLKPVTHDTNTSSYSVLVEIAWDRKEITRSLKIPAANYTQRNSYMRSFAQGISMCGNQIFLSNWNYITVVDYKKFIVVDAFSHNLMADNHGIEATPNEVFVCSTAIDAVLCFNINNYRLKWYWRPDDSGLDTKFTIPSFLSMLKKTAFLPGKMAHRLGISKKIKIPFLENEYRGTDKKKSPFHNHHLNEVKFQNGQLYLLSKGWNDKNSSSIIRFSSESQNANFMASPGSFCGAHDLLFRNSKIIVTESQTESIGWMNNEGEIKHKVLGNGSNYVRGIDATSHGFLVGFSFDRIKKSGSMQPFIREYDEEFINIKEEMTLSDFYPENIGGAIHNIYKIKDEN